MKRLLALALVISVCAAACGGAGGTFVPLGGLKVPRSGASATTLKDGRVLIAGGVTDKSDGRSAELYDPKTGQFTPTGSMTTARSAQAAVLLNDGDVLLVGGADGTTVLYTAEIYDPTTGTFSPTGSPVNLHDGGDAIKLRDGRVLYETRFGANIYDPGSGTFSYLAHPWQSTIPGEGGMAPLPDGRVLIAGVDASLGPEPAWIFDPATNQFSATDSIESSDAYQAFLLPTGRVLLLPSGGTACHLYDPTTGKFTSTDDVESRDDYSAVQLKDGRVLVAGGIGGGAATPNTDIYDPTSGHWASTAPAQGGNGAAVALLQDGSVLIVGGRDNPKQATLFRP